MRPGSTFCECESWIRSDTFNRCASGVRATALTGEKVQPLQCRQMPEQAVLSAQEPLSAQELPGSWVSAADFGWWMVIAALPVSI